MNADQHLKKIGSAEFIYVNTIAMYRDFVDAFQRFVLKFNMTKSSYKTPQIDWNGEMITLGAAKSSPIWQSHRFHLQWSSFMQSEQRLTKRSQERNLETVKNAPFLRNRHFSRILSKQGDVPLCIK